MSGPALTNWNRTGHVLPLKHQERIVRVLYWLPADYQMGEQVRADLVAWAELCGCTVDALRYTLRLARDAGEIAFSRGLFAYVGRTGMQVLAAVVRPVVDFLSEVGEKVRKKVTFSRPLSKARINPSRDDGLGGVAWSADLFARYRAEARPLETRAEWLERSQKGLE